MRHENRSMFFHLQLWQMKARCVDYTPPVDVKQNIPPLPFRIRLINKRRNAWFLPVSKQFGRIKTSDGWGIDKQLADRWISIVGTRIAAIEARVFLQAPFEFIDKGAGAVDPAEQAMVAAMIPFEDPLHVVWTVCDPDSVRALIGTIDSERSRSRLVVLQRLAASAYRKLPRVTLHHVDAVSALVKDFPNFSELIAEIAEDLTLRARIGAPLALPTLLLAGPSGIGKSYFVKRLCDEVGFHYSEFQFPQITAGWVLTGSNEGWASPQLGLFAQAILDCPSGKVPLIFGDELDKATQSLQFPPLPALLNALEPGTAERFKDEYLGCQIDLRPVSLIFAANRTGAIPLEVMSRLTCVDIREPTREEMPAIVDSVDRMLRSQLPMLKAAFSPLTMDVQQAMPAAAPRTVLKALRKAYARAASEAGALPGMLTVSVQHLHLSTTSGANQQNEIDGQISAPTTDLRPIASEAEYLETLREIETLMTAQPEAEAGKRLSALVKLVEAYEYW